MTPHVTPARRPVAPRSPASEAGVRDAASAGARDGADILGLRGPDRKVVVDELGDVADRPLAALVGIEPLEPAGQERTLRVARGEAAVAAAADVRGAAPIDAFVTV